MVQPVTEQRQDRPLKAAEQCVRDGSGDAASTIEEVAQGTATPHSRWQMLDRAELEASELLHLQRRLFPAPTFAVATGARQEQLRQHLQAPSGLVEHEWQCLEGAAESVHSLEQRLHAAGQLPPPIGAADDNSGALLVAASTCHITCALLRCHWTSC